MLFLFLIVFIIKIIKNNGNDENDGNEFEIYRKYNNQIYNELEINDKYINELLKSMHNSAPLQTKQLYENIIELGKKNINNFHSIIYSISPDDQYVNKRFNSDLRFYKKNINIKIIKAEKIYKSQVQNNTLDYIVNSHLPMPKDNLLNTAFCFF
jgi:L-fucose isomerase-like protein